MLLQKDLHGGSYIPPQAQPAHAGTAPPPSTQASALGDSSHPRASRPVVPSAHTNQSQSAIPMNSITPQPRQRPHPAPPGPMANLSASDLHPGLDAARSVMSTANSTAPLTGPADSPNWITNLPPYPAIPPDYTVEEREVPDRLAGGCNRCCTGLPCRNRRPHHYLESVWEYVPYAPGGVANPVYRHRDASRRTTKKRLTDRYLHHQDGRLRNLIVAASDDIWAMALSGRNETTWRRTYVRKTAPYVVRMASWVIDWTVKRDCGSYTLELCKAFCFMLGMICMPFSGIKGSKGPAHGGNYPPVLYKYFGDAKVWNNPLENTRGGILQRHRPQYIYRVLKPRYLCFLREARHGGIDIRSVDEWEASEGKAGRDTGLRYLFVAYSTDQFHHSNPQDLDALHYMAEAAARRAGIPAYWVACSCMCNPEDLEADVYRIADIVRGAEALIIALGPATTATTTTTTVGLGALLAQWGQRMWTFPEVLLSPGDKIAVYIRGSEHKEPLWINKSQFAAQVWGDAEEARQLIDHYLNTCVLSRLELAVLALRCLYRRATTQYLAGDQAYALMGLLRIRPEVDKTDTPFQAFSRLSLANDSDCLLERYLCMLPPDGEHAAWHYMSDAYGALAWDVAPYVQVAGVCDNDNIILDGAYAASIRWKSLHPVIHVKLDSWKRILAAILTRFSGWLILIGVLTKAFGGFVLVGIGGIAFLCMPWLIRVYLGGKFRNVEAALFGIEGYMSPATAERTIFGCASGRMAWSTNGSPLSRSYLNGYGELVGVDPCRDPLVREKVELAKVAMPGSKRIFTLIDTYSMEVTLFEATRPPTCLFLCASEGGLQRAIGCSYDFTSQTFYRETVLRMPSSVINRMNRVPRFRIGFRKPQVQLRRKA